MTMPRVSLRTMIALVSIIAADCAVLRYVVSPGVPSQVWMGVMAVLPMTNLLAIALYLLSHHRGRRPFLIGFLASGLLAVLILVTCFLLTPRPWLRAFETTIDAYLKTSPTYGELQRQVGTFVYAKGSIIAIVQATMTVLFTPPQLLLALIGG